jgi:predicted transcriptional regulator
MNGQVLVFNINLSLYDAINTLAEHNIYCAVIWNEVNRTFIDLLTIRDILEVLVFITEQLELQFPGKVDLLPAEDGKLINEFLLVLHNKIKERKVHLMEVDGLPPLPSYASKAEYNFLLSVLKCVKLTKWSLFASQVIDHKPEILLTKSLKDSLLDAYQEMARNKIHRLAIIESNEKGSNLCGIITHDMIMGYIISNMQGDPKLFEVPIKELDLDTKELIWKSYKHTLLEVLQCLRSKKISFLPIVGDRHPGGTAYPTIGFFSLKDLIKLIRDKKFHMVNFSVRVDESTDQRCIELDTGRRRYR